MVELIPLTIFPSFKGPDRRRVELSFLGKGTFNDRGRGCVFGLTWPEGGMLEITATVEGILSVAGSFMCLVGEIIKGTYVWPVGYEIRVARQQDPPVEGRRDGLLAYYNPTSRRGSVGIARELFHSPVISHLTTMELWWEFLKRVPPQGGDIWLNGRTRYPDPT
jgi:hypothetical protein